MGAVAFLHNGAPILAQHVCAPFGAIASVHNWDRVGQLSVAGAYWWYNLLFVMCIGSLLRAVARRILHLPLLQYVDDYFACDRVASADHAMQIFARPVDLSLCKCGAQSQIVCARLVRACLGPTAISVRKLCAGNPIVVLGVSVELDEQGGSFWPDEAKVKKLTANIDRALISKTLVSGEASKMSGQLQWASQSVFKRMGRALLRPIYAQIRARSPFVTQELELSLRWFREVLDMQLREVRPWLETPGAPLHLFSDARSTPRPG